MAAVGGIFPRTEAWQHTLDILNASGVEAFAAALQREAATLAGSSTEEGARGAEEQAAAVGEARVVAAAAQFILRQLAFHIITPDAVADAMRPGSSPGKTLSAPHAAAAAAEWERSGKAIVQRLRQRAVSETCHPGVPDMVQHLAASAEIRIATGFVEEDAAADDVRHGRTTCVHEPRAVLYLPPPASSAAAARGAPTPVSLTAEQLYELFAEVDSIQAALDRTMK